MLDAACCRCHEAETAKQLNCRRAVTQEYTIWPSQKWKRSGAPSLNVSARATPRRLNSSSGFTDESKRQAAFRWLGDKAEAQRLREEQTHHYIRWTLVAAVAAVIVGLIGVGLTFLH